MQSYCNEREKQKEKAENEHLCNVCARQEQKQSLLGLCQAQPEISILLSRNNRKTGLARKKIKKNRANALLFRFIALSLHSQNERIWFCPPLYWCVSSAG